MSGSTDTRVQSAATRVNGVFPRLSVGYYQLRFNAVERMALPEVSGSAWRGLLGHGLKRTVCVTRESQCANCLLYRSCAYPYIFETPPPTNSRRMRRYTAAPHPFVLSTHTTDNRVLAPGDALDLELTLFGRSNAYLPYIVHAFRIAGERGIGRGRGRFQLTEVQQQTEMDGIRWQSIWCEGDSLIPKDAFVPIEPICPDRVRLQLQSPLRVKRDEKLVGPRDFEFHDLFRNLLRRISMLMYFHTETPLNVDFAELTQSSRQVKILEKDLVWRDWTRYSTRQRTTMQMGGITGEVELIGSVLEPFWPYLWLGQWTHAGKGTSMGLGRYRIVEASSRLGLAPR